MASRQDIFRMLEVTIATGAVLGAWFFSGAVFIGLGFLLQRCLGLPNQGLRAPFDSFWLGLAVTLATLQIWSLFLPVDWRSLIFLAGPGLVGAVLRADRGRRKTRAAPRTRAAFLTVGVLLSLWLANRAIGPALDYDSGLYHFSAVRWAESHPVVPGLGLLHARLGFNSSHPLLVALLDSGPGIWTGRGHHFANPLLLLALLWELLRRISTLRTAPQGAATRGLFALLMTIPVFREVLGPRFSSPSPDPAVFVISICVVLRYLDLVLPAEASGAPGRRRVVSLLWLSLTGVTLKLNAALFLLPLAALALAWRRWPIRAKQGADGIRIAVATAPMLVLLVPWAIRGVATTGYLAYPLASPSLGVEWRIPPSEVAQTADAIRDWARGPQTDAPAAGPAPPWLGPWLGRALRDFDVLATSFWLLAGLGILLWMRLRGRTSESGRLRLLVAVLPAVLALVLWLVTAPDPRFATPWLWTLGGVAASAGLAHLATQSRPVAVTLTAGIVACFLAGLVVEGKQASLAAVLQGQGLRRAAREVTIKPLLQLRPGDRQGFHASPGPRFRSERTPAGLVLHVPEQGDQCWTAPIPCTPHPDARLRLRRAGDLASGFVRDDD